MAELDVGKQCSVLTCKQLDFLPFTCAHCSLIFCLEHRSTTKHDCTEYDKAQIKSSEKTTVSEKTQCHFTSCEIRELLPVECEFCEGYFCLRHRHQPDHACPKIDEARDVICTGTRAEKKIPLPEKKEKTGRGGVQNSKRAAKVALMKMKLNAVGDKSIPQEERVFFSVTLPGENSEEMKPMFFSKKWSVGRIIDEIAKTNNLENRNNLQTARKLRLFDGVTDNLLNIPNTLEEEMNRNDETLMNGAQISLRYV